MTSVMAASMKLSKRILAILLIMRILRRRRPRYRSMWVRPWIKKRKAQVVFGNLVQELQSEDVEMYRLYFRVDPEGFRSILNKVAPLIRKTDTNMRRSISPDERLAVTLRFLATGETFRSLSFSYRIGERTISEIVTETCQALYDCLKDDYLKVPSTEEEWLKISKEFEQKCNYPFCLGALDGKHVSLRQPACSGSEFFNYKHYFSILLLALVDANYRFIYVDVGSTGRSGDAGVFNSSTLKSAMDSNTLSFPSCSSIDGNECHYHIIADDAFPLRKDIVKPYPHRYMSVEQRVFNYRLSRARRVVENAFGILANRFRVFLTTICLDASKVEKTVLAACCLHNFLLSTQQLPTGLVDQEDDEHGFIPGTWRNEKLVLQKLQATQSKNCTLSAKGQRDILKLYFSSTHGRVSWQEKMI